MLLEEMTGHIVDGHSAGWKMQFIEGLLTAVQAWSGVDVYVRMRIRISLRFSAMLVAEDP
jgi:hypothetical protein